MVLFLSVRTGLGWALAEPLEQLGRDVGHSTVHGFTKCTTKEREPADVILIEGTSSTGPELADLVDLSILVAVPVGKRHARLRAREAQDFLAKWHERWDDVEAYYFTKLRPESSFDLLVSGE